MILHAVKNAVEVAEDAITRIVSVENQESYNNVYDIMNTMDI